MNRLCHILFLLINCIMLLSAQTPYDAYAPELYRPMIQLDAESNVTSWHEQVQADSTLYVVVVDTENSIVMLYNHTCDSLLASAPLDWNALMWLSVDPLHDKNISESPYIYCSGNPIMRIDPTGMDWYENEDGTAVLWKNSNDASINIDGVIYNNIGESYNHTIGNTTYGYHQNELASISTNVMSNENFISQFSKDDWNGTPAGKACNKACDAMLASAGFTSGSPSTANTIVENIDGRAGNASGNARSIISQMTDKLYAGYPLKACVDHKPGSSVADGIGDHFVVLMGITEYLSKGNVTGYSYRFFDPGTKWTENGVSGTFNLSNGRLIGVAPYGNHRPYTVTSLRFCR